jgi:hypothetical protein
LHDAIERKIPLLTDKPTIIFGADVTHPQPGEDSSPSIAAVSFAFLHSYVQLFYDISYLNSFILCLLNDIGGGIHGLASSHKLQGTYFCPVFSGRNYSRSVQNNRTPTERNCA